jgi:hypothetical protein
MEEFRYHDEMPATEGWPGGKRYGYHHLREYVPRAWSVAEQAVAAEHGIELPTMMWRTVEWWQDQPAPVYVLVESELLPLTDTWWPDMPVMDVTWRQRTVNAKRYGKYTWAYDPLQRFRPILSP